MLEPTNCWRRGAGIDR